MTRGFTVIEILIVVGIISICVVMMAVYTAHDVILSFARSDTDIVLTLLTHARALAQDTVCTDKCTTTSHGVHVATGTATLFQGDTYMTRDIGADSVFTLGRTSYCRGTCDVVFASSSAYTSDTNMILITGPSTTTIDINRYGRIIWHR
jgi:prepilin-type N-terminal cleavage/methylation domain-containing protein